MNKVNHESILVAFMTNHNELTESSAPTNQPFSHKTSDDNFFVCFVLFGGAADNTNYISDILGEVKHLL